MSIFLVEYVQKSRIRIKEIEEFKFKIQKFVKKF